MIFIFYDTPTLNFIAILGGKMAWWRMAEWSESKDNSLSRASLDDLAISIES